jgi:lantibiotic modifying enzyme
MSDSFSGGQMPASTARREIAWNPLADGDLAARICEAIDGITQDLRDTEYRGFGLESEYPFSLAYGASGVALFLSYVAASGIYGKASEATIAARARDLVEDSFTAVGARPMLPDLFRGFCGIAWVYEHVRDRLFPNAVEDTVSEMFSRVTLWCSSPLCPAEFLEGSAGICLYASELAPSPERSKLLKNMVEAIRAKARRTMLGTSWPVSRRVQASMARSALSLGGECPEQLGAAHGVSGIMACLAFAYAAGVDEDLTTSIVESSMNWMSIYKRAQSSPQIFPVFAGLDFPHHTTGWCNGDLGIGLALYQVGEVFGRQAWSDIGLEVLKHEAMKGVAEVEYANRNNCTLCHGSSGRLHIFNTLFQMTSEPIFAEAALFWLHTTLGMRVPGQGIGGYLVDEPSNGGPKTVKGFLMGAAGVGLALLGTITSQRPLWDKLLLASISAR